MTFFPPDKFIQLHEIKLRYTHWESSNPPLIFLPGLTANANSFDEIGHLLKDKFNIFSLDLRGRCLSDKPQSGYDMPDYEKDIISFIEKLGLQQITLVGHSYGGFVSMYLASRHPHLFKKMFLIDCAISENEEKDLSFLRPAIEKIRKPLLDKEAFFKATKTFFFSGHWSDFLENMYNKELEPQKDGSYRFLSSADAVDQSVNHLLKMKWEPLITRIQIPTHFFHATAPFGPHGQPFISEKQAQRIVQLIKGCQYHPIDAHHATIICGLGAQVVAQMISSN